jgi:hypothetical protein
LLEGVVVVSGRHGSVCGVGVGVGRGSG